MAWFGVLIKLRPSGLASYAFQLKLSLELKRASNFLASGNTEGFDKSSFKPILVIKIDSDIYQLMRRKKIHALSLIEPGKGLTGFDKIWAWVASSIGLIYREVV